MFTDKYKDKQIQLFFEKLKFVQFSFYNRLITNLELSNS